MVGQLDTSALDPGNFKSLRDLNTQNTLENQKINAGNIANAQAGNIYAAQALTGAVASGDQGVYDNTKAHLAGLGIDVSGLAPDIQTGAQQVNALRQAQYTANPLNALLGLGLKAEGVQQQATANAGNQNTGAAAVPLATNLINNLNSKIGGSSVSSAPIPQGSSNPGMNLDNVPLDNSKAAVYKSMGLPDPNAPQQPAQIDPATASAAQMANVPASAMLPQPASTQAVAQPAQGPVQQPQGQAIDANGSTATNFVAPARQPGDTQASYNQSYQQAFDAWKANPAVVSQVKQAEVVGEQTGKQTGAAAETEASYDKLFQNLEAMKKLNDSVPDSVGIDPETKAWVSKRTGDAVNPGDAGALGQWDQINHSQILNGLQQLVNQAGAGSSIRSNKTIVQLLSTGQGIPADLPKSARIDLINNLEAELKNTMTASENVKSSLQGQPQNPMSQIPVTSSGSGRVVHFNDLPQ